MYIVVDIQRWPTVAWLFTSHRPAVERTEVVCCAIVMTHYCSPVIPVETVPGPTSVVCEEPFGPANGVVEWSASQDLRQMTARYTCDPGFTRQGNAVRTCTDGFWTPAEEPTCEAPPGAWQTVENVVQDGPFMSKRLFGWKSRNYIMLSSYRLWSQYNRPYEPALDACFPWHSVSISRLPTEMYFHLKGHFVRQWTCTVFEYCCIAFFWVPRCTSFSLPFTLRLLFGIPCWKEANSTTWVKQLDFPCKPLCTSMLDGVRNSCSPFLSGLDVISCSVHLLIRTDPQILEYLHVHVLLCSCLSCTCTAELVLGSMRQCNQYHVHLVFQMISVFFSKQSYMMINS